MQMESEFSFLNPEFLFLKTGAIFFNCWTAPFWEKTVNLKHKGKIDRVVNGKWKITAFSDMLDKRI